MPIRDIENHLERADVRIERREKIEALREKQEEFEKRINLVFGFIAIFCALLAVYKQY